MKFIIQPCLIGVLLLISFVSSRPKSTDYDPISSSSPSPSSPSPSSSSEDEDEMVVLERNLMEIVGMNGTINDKVQPVGNRTIGGNGYGLLWKGKLLDGRRVALKFAKCDTSEDDEDEYLMYFLMGAIKNKSVENNGIPAIYHHGKFQSGRHMFHMMAMTFLGKTLRATKQDLTAEGRSFSSLDILLLLQKSVRTLKFIHGKKVIHNDIKPTNILFRNDELFIIDFDCAHVADKSVKKLGTTLYESRRCHKGENRSEMDDLESLFYTMIEAAGVRLPWEDIPPSLDEDEKYLEYKDDSKAMLRMCESEDICRNQPGNDHVKKTLKFIAQQLYADKGLPKYDSIHTKIVAAIGRITNAAEPMFSWLPNGTKYTGNKGPISKIHGPDEWRALSTPSTSKAKKPTK